MKVIATIKLPANFRVVRINGRVCVVGTETEKEQKR